MRFIDAAISSLGGKRWAEHRKLMRAVRRSRREVLKGRVAFQSLHAHINEWQMIFEHSSYEAPSKRPPPWFIGFSTDFWRSVDAVDKKAKGRILEALRVLETDPLSPRGDTIKALAGPLAGCWRYRIGDSRMIYTADKASGNLTCITYGPRGSVYDD